MMVCEPQMRYELSCVTLRAEEKQNACSNVHKLLLKVSSTPKWVIYYYFTCTFCPH